MAYISPSTKTTGTLITAAIWNADIVANSQASAPDVFTTAGDLFYATAADTGTRLALGTSGQRLQAGASAPSWEWDQPRVLYFTTTETTVTNTAAESSLFTYSLAGSSLAASTKVVMVELFVKNLQNVGASPTHIYKWKYGATTVLTDSRVMYATQSSTWYTNWYRWTIKNDAATNAQIHTIYGMPYSDSVLYYACLTTAGRVVTSAEDSTAAKDLAVTITQPSASASYKTVLAAARVLLW